MITGGVPARRALLWGLLVVPGVLALFLLLSVGLSFFTSAFLYHQGHTCDGNRLSNRVFADRVALQVDDPGATLVVTTNALDLQTGEAKETVEAFLAPSVVDGLGSSLGLPPGKLDSAFTLIVGDSRAPLKYTSGPKDIRAPERRATAPLSPSQARLS